VRATPSTPTTRARRLLSTPLIEVPLDQTAQQLVAFRLHDGFHLTVAGALRLGAGESAQ
jgi:hypothetical protein